MSPASGGARRPAPVAQVQTLLDRLLAAASRHGADTRLVLPASAVGVLLLGAGRDARGELLAGASAQERPTQVLRGVLGPALEETFPYLRGHLGALTGLLDERESTQKACREMLGVLAAADLEVIVEEPQVGGDLLGRMYSEVMAPADRSARGAFYTPPALASLMADLAPARPGGRVEDPCAGCGGLVIAAIRSMRRHGSVPALIHWHLGDIDRLALACAGVQVAAHGMPVVTLHPGDALALGIGGAPLSELGA